MIVRFHLHAATRAHPEIAHVVGVVASLLDAPWCIEHFATRADDGPMIFVGPIANAPAEAAIIVPCEAWTDWPAAAVRLTTDSEGPRITAIHVPETGQDRQLPEDWLRGMAFLLQREEEYESHHRDEWGCFAAPFSRLHEIGALGLPLVDLGVARLRRRLDAWAARRGRTLPFRARWHRSARFAVALTHDVDWTSRRSMRQWWRLLRQARKPQDYAFRAGLAGLADSLLSTRRGRDPYWTFDRWAELESGHGFRSTFYVVPSHPTQRHPYDPTYQMQDSLEFRNRRTTVAAMFRVLAEEEFEIGLHATYLSRGSSEEIAAQIQQLERAIHTHVRGVRQHFLRFDAADTWSAHETAGLAYDTTLGYNEAIGFRAGIAAPFHPWSRSDRRPYRLLELPLTVMDGALFRSLKLDPERAVRRVLEHLDQVESVGGLAVLLWHPNAADAQAYPGWLRTYELVLAELTRRNAWVTTAAAISDWWSQRLRELRVETVS